MPRQEIKPEIPAGQEAARAPAEQEKADLLCPSGHPAAGAYCTECGQSSRAVPVPWRCARGHECDPRHRYCGSCGGTRPDPGAQSLVPALSSESYRLPDPSDPEGVRVQRIHFTQDGFSFAGRVWLRGQELAITVGSPRWDEARSWISLTPSEQTARFGREYFQPGPLPGRVTARA